MEPAPLLAHHQFVALSGGLNLTATHERVTGGQDSVVPKVVALATVFVLQRGSANEGSLEQLDLLHVRSSVGSGRAATFRDHAHPTLWADRVDLICFLGSVGRRQAVLTPLDSHLDGNHWNDPNPRRKLNEEELESSSPGLQVSPSLLPIAFEGS